MNHICLFICQKWLFMNFGAVTLPNMTKSKTPVGPNTKETQLQRSFHCSMFLLNFKFNHWTPNMQQNMKWGIEKGKDRSTIYTFKMCRVTSDIFLKGHTNTLALFQVWSLCFYYWTGWMWTHRRPAHPSQENTMMNDKKPYSPVDGAGSWVTSQPKPVLRSNPVRLVDYLYSHLERL